MKKMVAVIEDGQNIKNELPEKQVVKYDVSFWKIWKHKRYIVAILFFLGFMNVYMLRSNLSIAIVDMTTSKNVTLENGTTILKKDFEWDSTIQGYVLSSFFYGYLLTQIFGGYLATKLGGGKVCSFGIAATSFFTLITPWVVKTNVYFFIVVRTIEGLCEGVTYSAMQEFWSHWAPPSEKNRLVSTAISGGYFGAVIAMPICSLIATNYNWETIFYVFGSIGLMWYIVWLFVVADTPSNDSKINHNELIYITESIRQVKTNEKIAVPWFKLLTSTAVIANTVALTCEGWGFYTMLTYMPQLMKSLLGFDLNQAGFLSALPYLVMSIMVQVSGQLADFLLNKGYLNTTQVRKLLICSGFLSQSIFILLAAYWVSNIVTPICLVFAVGFGGCALSSMVVNPLDVAPKFASVIFGISNTIATIPGIVTPILTGYIVTDPTSVSQWRIILFISSGIYFSGVIISLFFTTGERQPWAEKSDNKIQNEI